MPVNFGLDTIQAWTATLSVPVYFGAAMSPLPLFFPKVNSPAPAFALCFLPFINSACATELTLLHFPLLIPLIPVK
eukprot:1159041-Pelagomonas_calceolata.AAC.10